MDKKPSLSADEKIKYVKEYLDGEDSIKNIASTIGISAESFRQWIRNYNSMGIEAFTMIENKRYSRELKVQAVKDYLEGLGSQDDICAKYKIRSKAKLQRWISMYNSHNELKNIRTKGGIIMTKARTTTYTERINIVKYCIENQNDYAKTAKKYNVSYQQVYSWTKKYETKGVDALQDRRGKRKNTAEMSELEMLKAKNKMLEAENRRQLMEIEFLKKLEEVERRRY